MSAASSASSCSNPVLYAGRRDITRWFRRFALVADIDARARLECEGVCDTPPDVLERTLSEALEAETVTYFPFGPRQSGTVMRGIEADVSVTALPAGLVAVDLIVAAHETGVVQAS